MATYTPVPKTVPSSQRTVEITAVANGDQIDLVDALGRPARRVQFYMTDAADVIEYTLNSLKKLRPQRTREESFSDIDQVHGIHGKTEFDLWSGAPGFPSFSSTGSTVLETGEGLRVSSLQIDGLTLSAGATITVIAW